MRIAIYSRKSVDTGKGESIENQIGMCRDYIATRIPGSADAEIIVYEDEGFSGKSLDRPQFKRMLADCHRGGIDYIVCYRLDRISRSVSDFSSLIEDLNERKIAFICIKEQFDTSTPMGRAMMYIASVFAQLERETIAERVRDNMLMLARAGRWLGGAPPTGYLSEKVEEYILDGKAKTSFKLKINPDEIGVVKTIFAKYLELRSLNGVSKHLIREGVKGRGGKAFSLPGLKDILRNPVYCIADKEARDYFIALESDVSFTQSQCSDQYGLLSYNKRDHSRKGKPRLEESEWIIAIGRHKGIVSGADWVRVQEILAENRPDNLEAPKSYNDYSLLSGQVFCQKCGARMFAKRRTNNRELYDYICGNKLRAGGTLCDCQNLGGEQADDMVCDYLMDYASEDSGIHKMLEELRQKVEAQPAADPVTELDSRIDKTRRELDSLVATLASAGANESMIRHVSARMEELDGELAHLTGQKNQAEASREGADMGRAQLDLLIHTFASFKESFPSLTIHEKREFVRLFVQKMEWDGENLHIFIYGR